MCSENLQFVLLAFTKRETTAVGLRDKQKKQSTKKMSEEEIERERERMAGE